MYTSQNRRFQGKMASYGMTRLSIKRRSFLAINRGSFIELICTKNGLVWRMSGDEFDEMVRVA